MKTINGWVYKSNDDVKWEWWCYPFLNVRVSGITKTPEGAKRAAERTLKRMGFKSNIDILRPHKERTDGATSSNVD